MKQWTTRNESIQELITGFEQFGKIRFLKYAEYQGNMLWDLQLRYEKDGRNQSVRIGVATKTRTLESAVLFIEKYFKVIVAYAEIGGQAYKDQINLLFFSRRLQDQIPRRYERFARQHASLTLQTR
jgi:hypothetical protein